MWWLWLLGPVGVMRRGRGRREGGREGEGERERENVYHYWNVWKVLSNARQLSVFWPKVVSPIHIKYENKGKREKGKKGVHIYKIRKKKKLEHEKKRYGSHQEKDKLFLKN
jgi:hypothetical protein